MSASDLIALVAVFIACASMIHSLSASWRQDTDARYFEWWMRSMENRKADREEAEALEED